MGDSDRPGPAPQPWIDEVAAHIRELEDTVVAARREFGDDDERTLDAVLKLGLGYYEVALYDRARIMFQGLLQRRLRNAGDMHPSTADAAFWYGLATQGEGDNPDEAIGALRHAVTIRRRALGDEHPDTQRAVEATGLAVRESGDPAMAIDYFELLLAGRSRSLGHHDPETMRALAQLTSTYQQAGRTTDAVRLLESTHGDARAELGEDHPATLIMARNLGLAYHDAGLADRATALMNDVLTRSRSALGADHQVTLAVTEAIETMK